MTSGKRYFGTDGIRGRVGEPPMTPEFVLRLGWALGRVLGQEREHPRVVIGKDTRLSGYMLESALESGLSAAGANISLLGPMPTPAIAYLAQTFRARAGVVVSASHNPFADNGVKIFGADGRKLPDAMERAIEDMLEAPLQCVEPAHFGKAQRIDDAAGRYIEFCKSTFRGYSLAGIKLVVDCANGAAYHVAPPVFRELGAEVIALAAAPDGININQDCGSTRPAKLQDAVLAHGADLGIALDGDGDRCLMVDSQGALLDGDELLWIIARSRQRRGRLSGPVVGTLMSNLGLELGLKRAGIAFARAAVGDRHVLELLESAGGILGGESSGHIICLDRASTGDGIVAALQVLAEVQDTGQPLHALREGMEKCPQQLINVPVSGDARALLAERELQDAQARAESALGEAGRILLRPSGTEPLLRVMVEGEDAERVRETAESLAGIVARLAGAERPQAERE